MQILESSMLGLRAAQLVFSHRESRTTVSLFPMVHIGDRDFYEAAFADALSHDVVLEEGVNSPIGRRLARTYRWLVSDRLGLVVQPKLRAFGEGKARVVLADLSAAEFRREWCRIPLWLRLAVSITAPAHGLSQRFLATRESVADRMCLEDRQSAEEVLAWTPRLAAFWQCLGGARDARLIECLATELREGAGAEKRIAIVYGARHMRAVSAELVRRGFICAQSRWREVIAL